jgi:hypothetical protein
VGAHFVYWPALLLTLEMLVVTAQCAFALKAALGGLHLFRASA